MTSATVYRRLLLPVYLPTLLMSSSQIALMIMLPLYVIDLGYGPEVAATIIGVRGIGLLLFDVPAGLVVAKFGDKTVLVGGLALAIAGTLLLAIASSLALLAAAALLLGAGFAAWMLGRQAYIADTCTSDEVGRAISVMAGLQRVGVFIGPAAGGAIASGFGFPATFAVAAVVAALAGVCVVVFTRNVQAPHRREAVSLAGMAALVRENAAIFATAGSATLILQLMRATRQLLVPLVGAGVGLNAVEIGAIYSLSAIVDMSLFYPVGVVVDRWGRKWSAVPSILLFALALALLPFVSGYASMLAVGMALGLANGIGTGIVMIIGADLAQRTEQKGQFLGLWRLFGDFGMASAPLLAGLLAAVASLAVASLTVAGAGFIGGVVMAFLVPETLQRTAAARDDSAR